MLVKSCQLLGLLFPVVVIAINHYFFDNITAQTPHYSGAAVTMAAFGVMGVVFMIYAVTVVPTSLILLKRTNREYFTFQSVGWRAVMLFNWALLAFGVLVTVFYTLSGFIKAIA
ncbi:hypothetical protein [Alteromonas sp. H39]|uniref:hypothetical protein n=1 Tax=Alteromonas sp. H39 TaxID=3389876 RepID=UPI0039E07123